MLSKEEIHKKKEEKSAGRLSSSVKKTQGAAGHNFSSSISTIRKELGIVKKTEISKKIGLEHAERLSHKGAVSDSHATNSISVSTI